MTSYYMDGYLKTNLDTAKTVIKKDWDMVLCVDGAEGSGKSVLTQQCAYYCDPTLTIDRIVFTPSDLRKAIQAANKYESVIYDEAYTGLSSRATMSMINRALISMLAEIRQRNLFVFVVMPCFFDLDKYVALWRSRALIHVYTGKKFERGYFSFYNTENKKSLYIQGKKYYTYAKPKPNFYGRFTNHYCVDETAYRKKKRESLLTREKQQEQRMLKQEMDNELFARIASLPDDITHTVRRKILAMPESTYFRKLAQYRDKQELFE